MVTLARRGRDVRGPLRRGRRWVSYRHRERCDLLSTSEQSLSYPHRTVSSSVVVTCATMLTERRGSVTTRTSGDLVPEVEELNARDGAALFDKTARRLLGISGDEFLLRWDRGDYDDERENMAVTKVAMLIPFAR